MNHEQKFLKKIRNAEAKLAYASPKRAASLTVKIVKWKTSYIRKKQSD
jgi:hypothetical protein